MSEHDETQDLVEVWKKHRNQINVELSQRMKDCDSEEASKAAWKGFVLDELAGARLVVEQQNQRISNLEAATFQIIKGGNDGHKNG